MTLANLGDLVVLSLRNPAAALRSLQRLELALPVRWMLLLLAVTLSTIFAVTLYLAFPGGPPSPVDALLERPVSMAGTQLLVLALTAWLIATVGRMMGGKGDFPDALLLVAWVELLLVGFQLVQVLLSFVLPAIAGIMALMTIGMSIYLIIAMTKALHGFASTGKVVLGFFLTIFATGLVLSIVASLLGIVPEVPV